MSQTLYPAGPAELNSQLTALTSSYKLRAALAVLSIILFFLLYIGLVVGLGFLVYGAITYSMDSINKLTLLLKLGAIAGSVMLFAFTLKFIFKLKNHRAENRIELKQKDFPELWAFVHRICDDTGAPRPKAIYADPDVNAYVSYTNMWLSLFFPVKKELTIGMGLVSCLNLSEFKAVITHEFGHFAQRSMTIGSYIISANTIIHDMIFSRDKWDDLLDQWRGTDIRLSAAAWAITPVIWVIRQVLNLFYQFLNIMHSSLSREMEFNADKTAVSTSGSEAIISALWKLEDGFSTWNDTINHAYLADQKGIAVKNLYHHHLMAVDRNSDKATEQFNALPMDERGGKLYFSSSENSKVGMYASHPPNDLREANAKVPFVPCEMDGRSPWLLFDGKNQLQEEMTTLLYKQYLGKDLKETVSDTEFESFIAAETQGKELLEEYDNTFQDRFLNIPPKEELEKAALVDVAGLKTELKGLMAPVREIEALMQTAQQISQGTTTEKAFVFEGATYGKKQLSEGYNKLIQKREDLFNNTFKEWDAKFCGHFYSLAKTKNKQTELLALYEQHEALNTFYRKLVSVKNSIFQELANLQEQEAVNQSIINDFGDRVNNSLGVLNEELEKLKKKRFVELPNITDQQELMKAIVENGEFKKEYGPMFENGGFDRVVNQLESAVMHCQRIDQKSVAAILQLHHSLDTKHIAAEA